VFLATLTLIAGTGHGQGIPVIDAANLTQAIQQASSAITQIENQIQQISQLQAQLTGMTGSRMLGMVSNNPQLQNYVPSDAYTFVNAIDSSGYGGLTSTAKTLRDAEMIYNCLDLSGTSKTTCQAGLAQPYQYKGMLQDAMTKASGRLAQVTQLMNQINGTTDQKSVLEIQARVDAENAMLAHEVSQVQMLQAMGDSDDRIARSRDHERQYEALNRTGKISDYLP
jgi:type IV secretion system protein VirB5